MKSEKNGAQIVIYENEKETADNLKLRSFNKLCKILDSDHICIKRYFWGENQEQFRQNKDLWRLICCAGIDMLPATYVNGKIEKIEEYPTLKEAYSWISNASELLKSST
ncbi:MAG: arsenic metallochaperone ArsD family protein [Peptococcaceae bacterium]